jgi:hypothetical protein
MDNAEKCLERVTEAACGVIAMWRNGTPLEKALDSLKDGSLCDTERHTAAFIACVMHTAEVGE